MLMVMLLGARPTKGDARKINFRAVHVVAQVAAHASCGWFLVDCVEAPARGHRKIWPSSPANGAASAKEFVRKDTGAGCWDTGQDQGWRHQGTCQYDQQKERKKILPTFFILPFCFSTLIAKSLHLAFYLWESNGMDPINKLCFSNQ